MWDFNEEVGLCLICAIDFSINSFWHSRYEYKESYTPFSYRQEAKRDHMVVLTSKVLVMLKIGVDGWF